GSFSPLQILDIQYSKRCGPEANRAQTSTALFMGIRRCPNLKCGGLIAFVDGGLDRPQDSMPWIAPPEWIDFQTGGIPDKVVWALKEAIASHSVLEIGRAACRE